MSEVQSLSQDQFESRVLASKKPVVVDFYASWCGPCKMVDKHMNEIAEEYGAQVAIMKVDIDQNYELTQKLGIMSVPTMIVFKEGQELTRVAGYMPKAKLEAELLGKL